MAVVDREVHVYGVYLNLLLRVLVKSIDLPVYYCTHYLDFVGLRIYLLLLTLSSKYYALWYDRIVLYQIYWLLRSGMLGLTKSDDGILESLISVTKILRYLL